MRIFPFQSSRVLPVGLSADVRGVRSDLIRDFNLRSLQEKNLFEDWWTSLPEGAFQSS